MKKTIANTLSLLLIFTLASCNLPQKTIPQPTNTTSATVPPTVAIAESETVATAPTPAPEPLPSSYTNLLQEKVASGEWTQGEGLVILLKLFIGEIQFDDAGLGQGVKETEGTGVLRLASNYLQTGTDQAVKDEITRLLKILVPSQEALDRYSIPREQAYGRGHGLAAPARQDAEACNLLWSSGFPDRRTPSFVCFLFDDLKIADNIYRVYYPKAWHGDSSRDSYYEATLEAVQKSIALFQGYGSVGSIYFVFTDLTDERGSDIYASTHTEVFLPETEACPVIINPSAMTVNESQYKQIIAHEIFHCFQAWNLRKQLNEPGSDSDWWVEGTAEYFSNLVYPSVNLEHEWAPDFSELSTAKPLTNMTYENFAFFQFLGNRIGPVGVIVMLTTMPTAPGMDAQVAALAAVPGMEDTFEEFTRAVIDNTIVDSDGRVIHLDANYTEEYSFADLSSRDFSGQPFVLARYLINFASEKAFVVETRSDGAGRSAWRGGAEWAPAPVSAAGGCEDLPFDVLYVITTTPGGERIESVATTGMVDAACDRCLIGRWDAANVSIVSYMQSVIDDGGDDVPTVEGVTGTMFMVFETDGTGAGGYENLIVHETGAGGVATTEVFVTFEGFASGPYTTDGSALTVLNETMDILVTVRIPSVGSTTVPFNEGDLPFGSTTPSRYTCEGNTLTMWPPMAAEPIIYIRVSP